MPPCFIGELMDYFKPDMEERDVNAISMLGLAHVGDGVYELMTRAMLCAAGHTQVKDLHRLHGEPRERPCPGRGHGKDCRYADSRGSCRI
jgi:hypothetical protein